MRVVHRFVIVAAALLVVGFAAPLESPVFAASASTLFVNNVASCSDTGTGTQAQPYCTIQAAADVVNPGQTVQIAGGQYGAVTISRSGTPSAPIIFTGVREPFKPVPNLLAAGTAAALTLSSVHDVNVALLNTERAGHDGVAVLGSARVTMQQLGVGATGPSSGSFSAVSIDGGSSDITLTRSVISSGGGYGVRAIAGAQRVTVTTNDIASGMLAGVSLSGVSGAAVTSNNVVESGRCVQGITIDGGSSATVENNVVTVGTTLPGTCPGSPPAALSVAADSVGGVSADYNAVRAYAPAIEYSWSGTSYATSAAFGTATAQGSHDLDGITLPQSPTENSPLIDSADENAPGMLSTDINGAPRVDDPLVANTGTGSSHADRGASERQDPLDLMDSLAPSLARGVAPFDLTVTITSPMTSPWSEPITFTVDFGEGGGPTPITGSAVSHRYATPGTYTATVTAADTGGSRQTLTHPINVATPTPPSLSLTSKPYTYVDVNGRTSIMPGAAAFGIADSNPSDVASMMLDFGDGSSSAIGGNASWSHLYPAGTFTATATATDIFGRTSTATTQAVAGDGFLDNWAYSARVYDTRAYGLASVPAWGTVRLSLDTLRVGYTGVDAAVVNLTVTNAKVAGYLTVYPDGGSPPNVSNLNFTPGQTVANHAVAMAGGDGIVDFFNGSGGPIDLIVDSFGMQTHGQGAHTYQPDGPVRLLDTRSALGGVTGPIASAGVATFTVAGINGVPADADAVLLNVVATNTHAPGYVTAYGDGVARPDSSNTNWATGQTVSNLVVVPLHNGKVSLFNGSPANTDFVADLVGFYHQYGAASLFLPSSPQRLLDTRFGTGNGGHVAKLGPGQSIRLQVGGVDRVPATGTSAAQINLTVTNTEGAGYITAYPDGADRQNTSSLNYGQGQTVGNMAITPVGSDGAIQLYNGGWAPVDLIVDLYGTYYQYAIQ